MRTDGGAKSASLIFGLQFIKEYHTKNLRANAVSENSKNLLTMCEL